VKFLDGASRSKTHLYVSVDIAFHCFLRMFFLRWLVPCILAAIAAASTTSAWEPIDSCAVHGAALVQAARTPVVPQGVSESAAEKQPAALGLAASSSSIDAGKKVVASQQPAALRSSQQPKAVRSSLAQLQPLAAPSTQSDKMSVPDLWGIIWLVVFGEASLATGHRFAVVVFFGVVIFVALTVMYLLLGQRCGPPRDMPQKSPVEKIRSPVEKIRTFTVERSLVPADFEPLPPDCCSNHSDECLEVSQSEPPSPRAESFASYQDLASQAEVEPLTPRDHSFADCRDVDEDRRHSSFADCRDDSFAECRDDDDSLPPQPSLQVKDEPVAGVVWVRGSTVPVAGYYGGSR